MREILVKIMYQLGIKWYDLPYHEELVKEVIEKYIKKKLKKHLE
jgi:predicted Fe-Mo cluster-binding NifX family protein